MMIKKIRYKKKIDFDYFDIWLRDDLIAIDHEVFKASDEFDDMATAVSTYICPWCVKKYGLYEEVERTPESVDEELEYCKDENPEDFDTQCGVYGCTNGLGNFADLDWKDFEITDYER